MFKNQLTAPRLKKNKTTTRINNSVVHMFVAVWVSVCVKYYHCNGDHFNEYYRHQVEVCTTQCHNQIIV